MASTHNTMIDYRTILEINAIVSRCTNKGVDVEVLLKLIDFKDEINEQVDKYKKVFKEIMKEFSVPEIPGMQGQYDWSTKENPTEITKRINELFSVEVKVPGCNFLSPNDFVKLVDGFALGDISFLKKYLVRK